MLSLNDDSQILNTFKSKYHISLKENILNVWFWIFNDKMLTLKWFIFMRKRKFLRLKKTQKTPRKQKHPSHAASHWKVLLLWVKIQSELSEKLSEDLPGQAPLDP
jgi:hypothetical protein